MSKKVFVTGGSGFVGWNLTNFLLDQGYKVYTTYNGGGNLPDKRAEIISRNYFGINLENLKFDVVFHTAANNDARCQNVKYLNDLNVKDTESLFNVCYQNGCRHFVYSSSTAIYGNQPVPYIEDETIIDPLNYYGLSKASMEHAVNRFLQQKKDCIAIALRYCNVYGFGEFHKNHRASMIYQMIFKKIFNIQINLFNDGNQKRDWVYVEDVVKANYLASKHDKSDYFNVGSGVSVSFNELAEIMELKESNLLNYIDCPFEKEYQKHTLCSLEKINKCLGYNPSHNIKDNIINLEKKLREYFKMPSYIFH